MISIQLNFPAICECIFSFQSLLLHLSSRVTQRNRVTQVVGECVDMRCSDLVTVNPHIYTQQVSNQLFPLHLTFFWENGSLILTVLATEDLCQPWLRPVTSPVWSLCTCAHVYLCTCLPVHMAGKTSVLREKSIWGYQVSLILSPDYINQVSRLHEV